MYGLCLFCSGCYDNEMLDADPQAIGVCVVVVAGLGYEPCGRYGPNAPYRPSSLGSLRHFSLHASLHFLLQ